MTSNIFKTAVSLYACESYDLDMAAKAAGLKSDEMKSKLARMGVEVRETDTSNLEKPEKVSV